MKKFTFPLTALLFIGLMTAFSPFEKAQEAAEWKIDPVHSAINFSIRHFFTPIQGNFTSFSGTVNYDPEDQASGKAEFVIQTKSITTRNERRDNHLKSADFFDVEKFDTINFVSTAFVPGEDNKFVVKGELTMHGITKEVELSAEFLGMREHPRRKENLIGALQAETTLKRLDFGIGSGNFATTAVLGDEVKISIFLEISKPK